MFYMVMISCFAIMSIVPLCASEMTATSKRKQFAQKHNLTITIPETATFKNLNNSVLRTQYQMRKTKSQRSAAKMRASLSATISCALATVMSHSELCTRPEVGICSGFALFVMTGFAIHQAGSALTRYHGYWCDMALDQDFVKEFMLQRHTPEQLQEFLHDPFLRSTLSPTFVKMLEATWQEQE